MTNNAILKQSVMASQPELRVIHNSNQVHRRIKPVIKQRIAGLILLMVCIMMAVIAFNSSDTGVELTPALLLSIYGFALLFSKHRIYYTKKR